MQGNKTIEFALGSITYRPLNVPGRIRLLAALGVTGDAKCIKKMVAANPLTHVANMIDALSTQIVEIKAKKGDIEIDNFEDALNHDEFTGPLSEIATEYLSQLGATMAGAAGGKSKPKQRKSGGKKRR